MLLVSGTRRSGTSMWMQAMVAAGADVIGEAFPGDWGESALKAANPGGFYEGPLVNGVFFGTNPDADGRYLRPEDVRGKVAKVFVPGVLRTERAYIEGVVANVRDWREYDASARRLYALNVERRRESEPDRAAPQLIPPPLQWWVENFSLVRDASARGYPLQLQTYDQVLEGPAPYLERAIGLAGSGDLAAALAAVQPGKKTMKNIEVDSVEPHVAAVFDEFYAAIEAGGDFGDDLRRRCVELNRELEPQLHKRRFERLSQELANGAPPPAAFMMAAAME